MNNRVDYLSDRLVNLRGKHKSVNDVIPPDSIANGVSVKPAEKAEKGSVSGNSTALERRRDQTFQLYSDLEQRLLRRNKQSQLQLDELSRRAERLQQLQAQLATLQSELKKLQIENINELTPSQTGERFRAIDKLRLDFFETEAELEMLLHSNTASAPAQLETPAEATFKSLLKKGAAQALTVGLTIAAAILIGALILFAAWS